MNNLCLFLKHSFLVNKEDVFACLNACLCALRPHQTEDFSDVHSSFASASGASQRGTEKVQMLRQLQ